VQNLDDLMTFLEKVGLSQLQQAATTVMDQIATTVARGNRSRDIRVGQRDAYPKEDWTEGSCMKIL
jgi:hypothetical protein